MKKLSPPLLFWLVLATSWPIKAHHGTYTFDADQIIVVEGIVTRFNWTNPHSTVVIETQAGNTEAHEIHIEMDGPSILRPLGVSKNSLEPGDRVIAHVSPGMLENSETYLGREIIKEDGTIVSLSVVFARQQSAGNSPSSDSIVSTWVPKHDNLFEFIRLRNTSWELTPAGEASFAAYDIRAPFAQTECIAATAPILLMYPTAKVFTDHGDYIELNVDWMGANRKIYMDGRNHPPQDTTFYQGHSIGHWEGAPSAPGNILVVDTRNFEPNTIGNAFGIASGVQKHLTEKFVLSDGGRQLQYQYILADPEYLSSEVSGVFTWYHRPDVNASSIPCDLESASRHLQD